MLPTIEKRVLRILIVDDEAPLRTLFSMALEALDYESVEAESGAEALERLSADCFDLVLLDLSMPGMSGLDVLRILRERGDLTRVVILSAFIPGSAVLKAASYGVTNFIGKPITLNLLRETVAKALRLEVDDTPLDRAHEAAAKLNFIQAESILGREVDLSPTALLWRHLYQGLASGKGLHELNGLERGLERLVRHQTGRDSMGTGSLHFRL